MGARRSLSTGFALLALLVLGLAASSSAFAAAPVVEPGGALSTTPSSASVYAFVNPESETTSCVFEYGTTSSYGSSVPCEPPALGGSEAVFVIGSFSELETATTYDYRVKATNTAGETVGAEGEFTTLAHEAPVIDAQGVSGVTSTDASLEAQINPNFEETTYVFEYADNEALAGATVLPGGALAAGSEAQLAGPADIGGGLSPGATYYYRVVATNATGTTHGAIERFTTQDRPVPTSNAPQDVTRTEAKLSGSVDPVGAATSYHFSYVEQSAYEAALAEGAANPYVHGGRTAEGNTGPSYGTQPIGSLYAEELRPGTTYHFALVASNAIGTVIGPDGTFTTSPATPPLALGSAALEVGQLSATLTGSVDTRELATTIEFEFGQSAGGGSLVPAIVTSATGTVLSVSAAFDNNLQAGTTYYYRVVATNADGTGYGAMQSFTTVALPISVALPSGPGQLVYTPISVLAAKEAAEDRRTAASKPLTRAQKLAATLKVCAKRAKKQRASCRKQARKRYARAKKKGKSGA